MKNKKTHKTTVGKLDKIIDLKKKGLTLREIGVVVGLSAEGIRYLLNKYDLKKKEVKKNG